MAQQQAERERQIAARDADDYRRSNSRLLATSRARRAGSGVTSQGSPLLVDETTAAEIELGAQDILAGGAARAYGRQQEAALSRSRARSAQIGRAACRERGGTYVSIPVCAGTCKKKIKESRKEQD